MEDNNNIYKRITDLNSFVTVKGISYQVRTVVIPVVSPVIMTNTFMNETIIDTMKSSLMVNREAPANVVKKLMRQQHENMIHNLKLKHVATKMSKSEFVTGIRKHISKGNLKDALSLNEDAITVYPDNPCFMTYFGYLIAAVLNKHKEGINICKKAREIYQSRVKDGEVRNLSCFYLNIGRTYQLSGEGEFAINAYRKGLKFDPENKEAIAELAKLGLRKSPPLPFLDRNNPANKYLGLFLSGVGLR